MGRHHSLGVGQYRAGEKHVLISDKRMRRDATRRPVIYCPSHGNDAEQATGLGWIDPVVNALADAGFPVLSVDAGGPTTWGNDTAQTAITAALAYAGSAFGCKTDKALFLGTSMALLDELNWMRANPTKVAAVAGCVPAVNLADIHDNNRGGYTTEIETAYGGASGYATAVGSHNPAANASSYLGVPMKFWYATDDPICTPAAITAFASGSGAQTSSLGAVGHNPYSTSPDAVVAFLSQYA